MNAEGVTKSALLLMSLGEEEAAQVFRFLGPREVQKIGVAMAALRNVTREQVDEVLQEFAHEAEQHTALSLDSSEYIRSVLIKALGEDKAGAIIDRILQGSDTSGIEGLKWMDSSAVAELIKIRRRRFSRASPSGCATTCCCVSRRSTASSPPRCANSTTC
jgi:flagellar motor switch protein FliG